MMEKQKIWVVYPTNQDKGFFPSYCKTERIALIEKYEAERLTGFGWEIKAEVIGG